MRRVARRHPHDREIARLAVPALGALTVEPLYLLAYSTTAAVARQIGAGKRRAIRAPRS